MRRSGNCEENKRIIMDLDVVVKSHNCPYIVQCIGTFITSVSRRLNYLRMLLVNLWKIIGDLRLIKTFKHAINNKFEIS